MDVAVKLIYEYAHERNTYFHNVKFLSQIAYTIF